MRPLALAAILTALPALALAAGGEPSTPTQTSESCTGAQVFDAKTKTCVDARDSRLDDDTRLDGARELAAFGRADDALAVLATLDRPEAADALTVRGFATRKSGDFAGAMVLYEAALALDPGHVLARSYMGQGLAEAGRMDEARLQLAHLRAHGARGTWPEIALAAAIAGDTVGY